MMKFILLRTCFRSLSTIKYAKAVSCPQPTYGPMEIQKSEMLNGIKIVAAKVSGTVMAACTIMFQAGSRYETRDDLGASHFIRAASSGSGRGSTAFSKLRVLQQNGAYISCTTDRQTVAFTLRCPLHLFPMLKYYLVDAAARCCYHEWEISDRKQLVRGDLTRMTPEQRVLDLVQRASWAGPLANSVFCEDERIDGMTSETLKTYVKYNFKSSRCSVASVGVPFEETIKVAEMVDPKTEKPPCDHQTPPRFRSGSEYHDLGRDSDTWIAVAVRGCGTDHINNLFQHAIVASACGTDNMIQGQHDLDRTPQGPVGLMSGDDIFTDYRAFNISYLDDGIFGILAKTKAVTACKTAIATTEFLATVGQLNVRQIQVGKKRLQVSLAFHDEDCVKASEGLALQALNGAQIDSAQNAISIIDAISYADIAATANALSAKCDKMSIAIVGDVGAVPTDVLKYL